MSLSGGLAQLVEQRTLNPVNLIKFQKEPYDNTCTL